LLKKMVESTEIIITNDLPSLLAVEEVAQYRKVHKDQILNNLPDTVADLSKLVEEVIGVGENDPEVRRLYPEAYHATNGLIEEQRARARKAGFSV
jgi:hypothetical protein